MNHRMEQWVQGPGVRTEWVGGVKREAGREQSHKHGINSVCDIHWDHNRSFVSQRVKAPSKCGCFLGALGCPASLCGPSRPSNLKVLASLDFSYSL